jgi:signal transduction histidine kinase
MWISSRWSRASARIGRVRLGASAASITLAVDDDGPGIPVVDQQRVFVPFERLDASRSVETGGTGLGLSIARTIARAHGGDVTLANRAEGGLRVTIALPR